jgi:hypothetical protein
MKVWRAPGESFAYRNYERAVVGGPTQWGARSRGRSAVELEKAFSAKF